MLLDRMFEATGQGTFTLNSSWGNVVVDASNGWVIPSRSHYYPDPKNENPYPLRNITAVDIAEWRKTYPNDQLEGLEHDILDFGYWQEPGHQYVEPDADWRAEFREKLASGEIHPV